MSALEVLHIAGFLRAAATADQLADVHSHVAEVAAKTRGLDHQEHARAALACALLVDERCSVYGHRPFACRATNSANAEDCRAALGDGGGGAAVATYQHQRQVFRTIGSAAAAGLRDAGRAQAQGQAGGEILELTVALDLALAHDDPVAAWKAGALDFSTATARQA